MSSNLNVNYGNQTPQWDAANTNINVQTSTGTNQTTETTSNFKTTIQASQQHAVIKNYINDPSKPGLLPSTVTDPSGGLVTLQHLFDFPTLLNNMISAHGAPEGSAAQKFITDSAQPPVTDPDVIALAEKEGIPPQQMMQDLEIQANIYFKQQLAGLPQNVQNQLEFGAYMPQGAASLSPELQAQLQTITGNVNAQLAKDYGLPTGWQGVPMTTPTSASNFADEVSNQYDVNFENALNQLASANNLPSDQVATLKSMHYMPGAQFPANPTMQNYLKSLNDQAFQQLQDEYGFGYGFTPSANSAYYASMINGAYIYEFQQGLNNIQPPVSDADIAMIQKYVDNPNDPSVPDKIKNLVQTLNASIIPGIISKYSLPTNWQPTVSGLTPPGVDQNSINVALNGLQSAQDIVKTTTDTVLSTIPAGPEQNSYLNFLKLIGEAIDKLQQSIYAMQAQQSNSSKSLSRINLELQLNSLARTQVAAQQTQQKEGKMQNLGPLGQIMTWITNIVLLAVAFCAGPVVFAVALAFVIDNAVAQAKGTTPLIQQMFKAISNAIGPQAGMAVNFLLCALLSSGNPILMSSLVFQDSNCVQDLVKTCGGDEEAQQITAAVFNMVSQVVIMVAMSVATGGAAAPAAVAEIVSEATGIGLETAINTIKAAQIASTIVITSLQVVESSIQINNDVLLAQIDIIKGSAEAYAAQIEGIIDAIKKLIDKLLAMLQGNSDWLVDIANFQGKKFTDASFIASQIAS